MTVERISNLHPTCEMSYIEGSSHSFWSLLTYLLLLVNSEKTFKNA